MLKTMNYWTVGGSVEDAMLAVKKAGFDAIELCFGESDLLLNVTEKKCIEIKSKAKEIGLKLPSLATGFYWGCSLASSNKKEAEKAFNFTKKYLQVASWLGANAILVVPGAVQVPWDDKVKVMPYDEVWKNATKALKKLIPLAQKLKVSIALENVWNSFLLSPMEFKLFLNQFKSNWIGIYFDTGNVRYDGFPDQWINILGKKIKRVHFKNYNTDKCKGTLAGFEDTMLKGDVDWKSVLAALKKVGYKGPATVEMIPFKFVMYGKEYGKENYEFPSVKLVNKLSKELDIVLKS